MSPFLIPGVIFVLGGYFILLFVFDLLLRGFHPFIPSRPWVVEQLMPEIHLPENKAIEVVALSSGRSGFFYELGRKYPNAKLIGYEFNYFPYIVAKTQAFIRRTNIEIHKTELHRVDVSKAEFVYCHLKPDMMRDLRKKLKFECKSGAWVVSTGFNIPYMKIKKIVDLPDKKGRLAFLSKNQNLFERKAAKFKKEKKAYFYEI